jgi:hypothetical protein
MTQQATLAGMPATAAETHDKIVCPVARTADIISGKWTLLIIRDQELVHVIDAMRAYGNHWLCCGND